MALCAGLEMQVWMPGVIRIEIWSSSVGSAMSDKMTAATEAIAQLATAGGILVPRRRPCPPPRPQLFSWTHTHTPAASQFALHTGTLRLLHPSILHPPAPPIAIT